MEFSSIFCEECKNSPFLFQCIECEQKLCQACDDQIHRGGKRKTHTRLSLCQECKGPSSQYCYTCSAHLCNTCQSLHYRHNLQKILSQSRVAVYWDLSSLSSINGEDVVHTIQNIEKHFDLVEFIRVYGDNYYKLKDTFDRFKVEFNHSENIKEIEVMLIDISLLNKDKVSHVFVISARMNQLKIQLDQIQTVSPGIKILVSVSFPAITPVLLGNFRLENKNFLLPPKNNFNRHGSTEQRANSALDQFPVYQNFARKKGQTVANDHLLTFLKELADTGIIMHESGWLSKTFAQKSRIGIDQSYNIIKETEKLGHLHMVDRSFCDLKTMSFTSLKLESISMECLIWTLRSLKVDEMLPTERAVQSRIKEVFDYKISPAE